MGFNSQCSAQVGVEMAAVKMVSLFRMGLSVFKHNDLVCAFLGAFLALVKALRFGRRAMRARFMFTIIDSTQE